MIKKVNLNDFIDRFRDYDRQDKFSRAGLECLFNYYEELEEETGKQIELDVIGICIDWVEYSEKELIIEYEHLVDSKDYDCLNKKLDEIIEKINYNSEVIQLKDSWLVRSF